MDKQKLVTVLRRVDLGKDRVFVRFLVPVQFALTFFTWLKVYNVDFSLLTMFVFALSIVAAIYIIGYFYDKTGLWSEELEFDNRRNPVMKELREHMIKIEEEVKKLGKV